MQLINLNFHGRKKKASHNFPWYIYLNCYVLIGLFKLLIAQINHGLFKLLIVGFSFLFIKKIKEKLSRVRK
jgi:hypothetical protein